MLKRLFPRHISYYYAFFLIYVLPLAIPVALWTLWEGLVTANIVGWTIFFYCVTGLGISVGYHRLATHRSFQAHWIIRRLLFISGAMALQGPPCSWASLHIQHHRFADRPGDPHSPEQHGMWYAHCGWLFHDYKPNYRLYGKWLLADKDIRHVSRYFLFYGILGLVLPWLIAGWVGFVWAGLIRVLLVCHATWCVNSICHRYGKREFSQIKDTSTNHWFIALITFGEGWHHNHHRFMQSPFFGHKWYQIDMGKWLIVLLNRLSLADDLKTNPMAKHHGAN